MASSVHWKQSTFHWLRLSVTSNIYYCTIGLLANAFICISAFFINFMALHFVASTVLELRAWTHCFIVDGNEQFMVSNMVLEHMISQQVGFLKWSQNLALATSTEDRYGWAQLRCPGQNFARSLKLLRGSTVAIHIIWFQRTATTSRMMSVRALPKNQPPDG
jgi:hypothetical protein